MESQIKMLMRFYRTSATTPKTNNVYWCILRCLNLEAKTTEYHYSFVEYNGKFEAPVMEGFEFEVVVWCELEDPQKHFKEKKLIIV